MRKPSFHFVFVLIFGLTSVAFGQGDEAKAWQAVQGERDARRRVERLESLLRTFPNSPHRPEADKMLIDHYVQTKDNAKIVQHAEAFRQTLPGADNGTKAAIYIQAMLAAATLNNVAKTLEFGNDALAAEPNNITVMGFLAGNNLPDPAKALEYAQKVITSTKPASMAEANYQSITSRMHAVVGDSLLGQNKFSDAHEHYLVASQVTPKNHVLNYRLGFVRMNLMARAAQAAETANNDLLKATTAQPLVADVVASAQAKLEAESTAALEYRDAAMDAFARSVAVGGQFAAQAKQFLESLYENKNKSLNGLEQFIADRK